MIGQRSSSVSSPRQKPMKKYSENDIQAEIEAELDNAYVDSEKKLSFRNLEEEDIESLFEDDDLMFGQRRGNNAYNRGNFGKYDFRQYYAQSAIHQQMRNMKEVEISFEDDTTVTVEVDINITSINLISTALEKRGWSKTMAYLFHLCIIEDNIESDECMIVTLEDNANPILSLPNYSQTLNLRNPKFIIQYKNQ